MPHEPTPPPLPAGLPEDWRLPVDLNCPKCAYNLRMQREPRCPECGFVFRWQSVLAITCPRCDAGLLEHDGPSCPRCNLELAWDRLFETVSPAMRSAIEYHPRPLHRFIPTARAALRPARFWRGITIETPPVKFRLWTLSIALQLLVFGCWILSGYALVAWLDCYYPEILFATGTILITLPVITNLALPRFTPTLATFSIRSDQLLRIAAYSWLGLFWLSLALLVIMGLLLLVNLLIYPAAVNGYLPIPAQTRRAGGDWALHELHFDPSTWLTFHDLSASIWMSRWYVSGVWSLPINYGFAALVWLLGLIWWWRFQWLALRAYLKLDRHNALALLISTQIIAVLIGITIAIMAWSPELATWWGLR